MPTVKETASAFLASKRIAVTGVSRKPQRHGGNAVYKRLRERGYQVFVVNPAEGEVEGDDEDLTVLLFRRSAAMCPAGRAMPDRVASLICGPASLPCAGAEAPGHPRGCRAPQASGQVSGTGGPSCAGSSRCRSARTPRSSGTTCRRCRARASTLPRVLAAHSRRARSRRLIGPQHD